MKKNIIIGIVIFIILLIVGVWAYLFIYATPESRDEVFARFGIGRETSNGAPSPTNTPGTNENTLPQGERALRQLTLKPVAGATFINSGILYVEQGTGHIYRINFDSFTETLVSGTTIPGARDALFSPDGTYVAITTAEAPSETLVASVSLGSGAGSIEGVSLPLGAHNIAFGNGTNTLMYSRSDGSGTSGYSYDLATKLGTQIFTIPLRDVRVLWGDTNHVYTTPTATQKGYLYRVGRDTLSYVTEGGSGLMGIPFSRGIVVTHNENETSASYALMNDGEKINMPFPLIPEKCTTQGTTLYCGVAYTETSRNTLPDDWYKGTIALSDALWSVDVENGSATLLSDFLLESGRDIDVNQIGTDEQGTYIYFINKNDNTLWMFNTRL